MSKKLKTYIVPTIVHCQFGTELLVQAESPEHAAELVRKGEGEMASGDGYEWDRSVEDRYEIGDWQPITEVDEEDEE